jgi:lysophospholipid acyltransferase (LPLAT)-like uncharacterized protein
MSRNSLFRKFRKTPFGTKLISDVVAAGVNGLNRSLRLHWIDRQSAEDFYAADRPFIFAYWHSDLIVALRIGLEELHRHPIVVMVSPSRDGLMMANLLGGGGMTVVRASSNRGGMEGFMAFARKLRSGMNGSMAVDGPRGPRRIVKNGVIRLSQMTGVPIIPFAVGYERQVTIGSWDRLRIPLPFTTASAVCGTPIHINRKLSLEESDAEAEKLGHILVDLRKRLPYDRE